MSRLGLANPQPHRLGFRAELLGDRADRFPLRPVLVLVVEDHPHRPVSQLVRVLPLLGHRSILLKGWSLHQTRGASFAKICGACPIPAGSGKTKDDTASTEAATDRPNAALYRAAIVRMRWHEPTIAYVTRRTAEGLSKKDIIRCLKRYLARELYHLLPPTSSDAEALELRSVA